MHRISFAVGVALCAGLLSLTVSTAFAQPSFVNWETPHVSPMAISPSGDLLFVVNTPDNRLEIFDITHGLPAKVGSVPVGLDPVSVRARTDNEVWVINHISDSISIVNVANRNVVRTIPTGDEPTDVVFAGTAGRAFVTCSQLNQVKVFDPNNLAAPPVVLNIQGEDPRALAVSPDGSQVYAAIFESGNGTTAIDRDIVSNPTGPHNGQNPPPNDGPDFNPPIHPGNPTPPAAALILKKATVNGPWTDDNSGAWSPALVPWDLHDHDLAVIDANTLQVSYVQRLMNLNMHLTVRPDGQIAVVGTDAINEIRFEPNLTGRFVHSIVAFVDLNNPQQPQILDLNPHLADAYTQGQSTVPQNERDLSIADPRGIVWRSDNSAGYVSGMGSHNVVRIDAAGARLGQIEVGAGPTGVALDEGRDRLYVLNKFDGTLSVIDTAANTEMTRVPFYDPTPAAIKDGRPFLYDARRTSGLGVTACASCHADARMDQLAWDLGNPADQPKDFNQVCQTTLGGTCEDWHPLKGPMTTQTLQNIINTEPMHWRGDRENLFAFNGAFISLLGDDTQLTMEEMQAYEDFLATIKFPPNPNRNINNTLKTQVGDGNPVQGESLFLNSRLDGGVLTCNQCHAVPTGTNTQITPATPLLAPQSMKIPQLRNMYEKTGFLTTSTNNNRGFGFTHDGSTATLFEFLQFPLFLFQSGEAGNQQRRNIVAFLMSFATDTHAGVGVQVTLDGANNSDPAVITLISQMLSMANLPQPKIGVVVKGRQGGIPRGYAYLSTGLFQSDRNELILPDVLRASASAGNELTYTIVPLGTQTRIGIDRDGDGFLDQIEIDQCGDPANPAIGPNGLKKCDSNCDGTVDFFDIDPFIQAVLDPVQYAIDHPSCNMLCNNDVNNDGAVDFFDIDPFVACVIGP